MTKCVCGCGFTRLKLVDWARNIWDLVYRLISGWTYDENRFISKIEQRRAVDAHDLRSVKQRQNEIYIQLQKSMKQRL